MNPELVIVSGHLAKIGSILVNLMLYPLLYCRSVLPLNLISRMVRSISIERRVDGVIAGRLLRQPMLRVV